MAGNRIVAIVGSYRREGTIASAVREILSGAARYLGARPVETIFIGLAAQRERQPLSPKVAARCRRAGRRLAGG